MATSYTPGLRVSAGMTVRKTRRLPLKGEVLVAVGQRVAAADPVARAQLPGKIRTVKVSEVLGVDPGEVPALVGKEVGDTVAAGELLAETRSFFGLFRAECTCPATGTIDHISGLSGFVGVREPPIPLELDAYLDGVVAEVLPDEGVVVEAAAAFVQGIFGVGGERRGALRPVAGPDEELDAGHIPADAAGQVLVGGCGVLPAALTRAAEVGIAALVTGGIADGVLRDFVGREIGVAITGQEQVPFTLILTEGFGRMAMAGRTWRLLSELAGRPASVNGATQIRAGVIRPEVIVPLPAAPAAEQTQGELAPGAAVRVIREPFFGRLGRVTALPAELVQIDTEALVRVAQVEINGEPRPHLIPRANLELIW